AWLGAGSDGWAQGSPWPLALDLLALGLVAAAAAAIRLVPRRWLAEGRVARAMDEAAGLEPGSVEGALELSRALPAGVSAALAAHGEGRVAGRLEADDAGLAGGLGTATGRWVRRGYAGFALLAPVAALLLVMSPERATNAWSGLGSPLQLLARPVLPPLVVHPGDAEILRGRPLVVSVEAEGRSQVTLRWRAAGDVPRERTVATAAGGARFRLEDVTAEIRYRVTAPDGAASREHVITPVDPLLVSDVALELSFPPHTGRPPEEYRGDPPPLVVPAGTRVAIEGRASRSLSSAGLEREEDGLSVPLEVADRGFSGVWTPRESGLYAWRFLDREGGAAELAPALLDLTVVPDSAPSVRFSFPGRDTVLPLSLRQPLVIEARDDHGVRTLELVAFRVTSLGERREPVRQRMDLGGTRAAVARPVLDLTGWGLLPGDTVRYFARVVDDAPSGAEGLTREYVLSMPGAADMRRDAQNRMEAMAERLEELAGRAEDAGEQARNMERQAEAARRGAQSERPEVRRQEPQGPDFSEREELRSALEEQSSMLAEVDSARRELEALAEAMREAGTADPQLQRDLRELQELMEEAAPEEMRARLEEMAQRLGEREMEGAQETLRQLMDEQEAFRERLEQSLERLRRAAVEQDFRATEAEAEELAREERALADALEEGDQPGLRAEQQERLQEEAQALRERIERLQSRLDELGEEDARQGVERADRQTREAQEAMEEAGREAREAARSEETSPRQAQRPQASQGQAGQPQPMSRAAQRAQEAAEGLQEAAQELRDAQQQMAEQKAQRAQEAFRQTAEDALSLARRQGEIREQMQGPDAMAELRGDEAALMQGVRSMADNLQAAAGEGVDPGAMRQLSGQMGQAMQAIQGTVDAMEGRRGAAPSPRAAADAAMDALNRLALSAMEGAQAMAQGAQQGGQQGQDAQERLEQVAQQQGSLNNQAGQVMPMQLGQQAMAQQMQELAQGQQQVAGELGEMAQEPGASEQALGDLEALAREAAALAEQMREGRLDADTRERQERLFHRLLDAGRSLENDEVSEERESTAAGTFEAGEVMPLDPSALGGLPFAVPDAAALLRLSPAERQLVLQYFERLNRETPSGGDPPPEGGP
ncbi:MAG: hypothetical protein KY453_00220, partial [Gemmatimonadetes bacterium]|nr:hypothetical protein [Gemmatimonadota bacterium]